MKSKPSTNPGIRWKLLLAFGLAFFVPLGLSWLGVSYYITAALGVVFVVVVYWYVQTRILAALNRLLRVAQRINANHQRRNMPFSSDELTNLVHTFDHFFDELESTYKAKETPESVPQSDLEVREIIEDPSDTVLIRAVQGRAVFRAKLSTGDSVVGESAILPSRVDEEMVLNSRLTGSLAAEVFDNSIAAVQKQLDQLSRVPELSPEDRGIMEFQSLLLEDASLHQGIETCLADGLNLPESLNTTFAVIRSKLEMSRNVIVAARAADCDDLRQRLLSTISQLTNPGVEDCYSQLKGKIVFCQQIYPSEVIMLHKAGVKGIASVKGTASSHAEILMQSFNIPSLSNIEGISIHILKNRRVMLDTEMKQLIIDPSDDDVEASSRSQTNAMSAIITDQIKLKSGQPITIQATINNVEIEAERASTFGADGVGLFRSEMSYIGRPDVPDEDELYEEYHKLTQSFEGKPVTLRMLDLGSDKISLFQSEEREENPCMGSRSMRLLLRRPGIFRTQLRAMLRAAHAETTILFPMISGWHELDKIRTAVERMSEEFFRDGGKIRATISYGMMVEVPSVVERFEDYVENFDVFNIGTNDLTQYTLAADRNNENVAEYFITYHPSVLSMIEKVCRVAGKAHKRVCICGEMASEMRLIPLLIGLGANSFSIPYHLIPKMKQFVSTLNYDDCRRLGMEALESRSTDDVEDILADYADQFGNHNNK